MLDHSCGPELDRFVAAIACREQQILRVCVGACVQPRLGEVFGHCAWSPDLLRARLCTAHNYHPCIAQYGIWYHRVCRFLVTSSLLARGARFLMWGSHACLRHWRTLVLPLLRQLARYARSHGVRRGAQEARPHLPFSRDSDLAGQLRIVKKACGSVPAWPETLRTARRNC